MSTATLAAPSYRHLAHMTTPFGLFEHARHGDPRPEHGYCTDDVARALVVTLREPEQTAELARLSATYLDFIESAVAANGGVRNRMDRTGHWTDEASVSDCWGRAVTALGFAAARAREPYQRTRALRAFHRAAGRRSPFVRASSFAVLGAAEVLRAHPDDAIARGLLAEALAVIPLAAGDRWTWPEQRLRYANATLCEALILGGDALGEIELRDRGLELLAFLLALETSRYGWLSVAGTVGRGPGETGPFWDQQPIEPAAIADACASAFAVTGDRRWLDGVRLAWGWFLGENDRGIPMLDAVTGAGYDGLQPTGRNDNRGAESTLAALSTFQHARALGLVGPA